MDVAIVGAGIMGRMLAWELLQAGHQVDIFDQDDKNHGCATSYAAAGMLAPYGELLASEPMLWQMGMDSLPLWAELALLLGAESLGYRSLGSVTLAHGRDRAEWENLLRRLQASLPVNGAIHYQHWDHEQLQASEPDVPVGFTEAMYFPREAWVDNRKTLARLGEAIGEAGGRWHEGCQVSELKPHQVIMGGVHRYDCVMDCRGLGAMGDMPSLRGVRGELLQVEAPGVEIQHLLRLLHPRQPLYLVPQGAGRYLLGATQIESHDESPVSVRSAMALLNVLYSIHPGFAEARILDWRVSCRPALPDNLPCLSISEGLLRVNGLFRHGFLLSPLLAREIAQWLAAPSSYCFRYPAIVRKAPNA